MIGLFMDENSHNVRPQPSPLVNETIHFTFGWLYKLLISSSVNSPCNKYMFGSVFAATVFLIASILLSISLRSVYEAETVLVFKMSAGVFFLFLNSSRNNLISKPTFFLSSPSGALPTHIELNK